MRHTALRSREDALSPFSLAGWNVHTLSISLYVIESLRKSIFVFIRRTHVYIYICMYVRMIHTYKEEEDEAPAQGSKVWISSRRLGEGRLCLCAW